MPIIKRDGFLFQFNQDACSACLAKCCRGSCGNIWVNSIDMLNICELLGVNIIDGINKFFERRDNRYSIRERFHFESVGRKDFPCIFLDSSNRCSIYPVRPLQCRTFPFWTPFKKDIGKIINECPGVL